MFHTPAARKEPFYRLNTEICCCYIGAWRSMSVNGGGSSRWWGMTPPYDTTGSISSNAAGIVVSFDFRAACNVENSLGQLHFLLHRVFTCQLFFVFPLRFVIYFTEFSGIIFSNLNHDQICNIVFCYWSPKVKVAVLKEMTRGISSSLTKWVEPETKIFLMFSSGPADSALPCDDRLGFSLCLYS